MADIFISYRNTPERRAYVRRLATILRAHGISVWWDYGLEAGERYADQIMAEIASAKVVTPLWCSESIKSEWVAKEATAGRDRLLPARLEKVTPPAEFEPLQAADLIDWRGEVQHPRLLEFVRQVATRAGKPAIAAGDMLEELRGLPPLISLTTEPKRLESAAAHVGRERGAFGWATLFIYFFLLLVNLDGPLFHEQQMTDLYVWIAGVIPAALIGCNFICSSRSRRPIRETFWRTTIPCGALGMLLTPICLILMVLDTPRGPFNITLFSSAVVASPLLIVGGLSSVLGRRFRNHA